MRLSRDEPFDRRKRDVLALIRVVSTVMIVCPQHRFLLVSLAFHGLVSRFCPVAAACEVFEAALSPVYLRLGRKSSGFI
jgi:hypothetical protein